MNQVKSVCFSQSVLTTLIKITQYKFEMFACLVIKLIK